MSKEKKVNRREFLQLAAMGTGAALAACTPQTTPTATTAPVSPPTATEAPLPTATGAATEAATKIGSELIGQAFLSKRPNVLIATKVGVDFYAESTWEDFSPRPKAA